MNHALQKGITCFPWEICNLTLRPRGTKDNDFMLSSYLLPSGSETWVFLWKERCLVLSKGHHTALCGTVQPWHPPQRHLCVLWGFAPGMQTAQTFCPSAAWRAKPRLLPAQGNRNTVQEQRQPLLLFQAAHALPRYEPQITPCPLAGPRPLAAPIRALSMEEWVWNKVWSHKHDTGMMRKVFFAGVALVVVANSVGWAVGPFSQCLRKLPPPCTFLIPANPKLRIPVGIPKLGKPFIQKLWELALERFIVLILALLVTLASCFLPPPPPPPPSLSPPPEVYSKGRSQRS